MALSFSTALRTTRSTAIVTEAGVSNATMKFYNGTKPASLGAVSTQTLLATLTFSSVIGTVANGVLTFGAVSQNNANHVNGTPTWVRISKADTTVVMDIDIGAGNGNMQFTGTVATGVNITLNASTLTEGNV
jgi:hypothetical protein